MEQIVRESGQYSRRSIVKGLMALGSMAVAPALLGACSDATSGGSSGGATLTPNKIRAGSDIPKSNINIGLAPFGDHVVLAVGMAKGWFDELGITVKPKNFSIIQFDQVVPLITNNDYQITSQYGPTNINDMANAPDVRMFGFVDIYSGVYVLAPPGSHHKQLSKLLSGGASFKDAIKEAADQLRGAKVSIDKAGTRRPFFNLVLQLSGLSVDDLQKLYAIDDSQMLLMANGGKLDFVIPQGGTQTAKLLNDGWYPIIADPDIVEHLPTGDKRAVEGLGSSGLATSTDYYVKNPDAIYRVTGIMFRCIDAIKADVKNKTDDALKIILPVLTSAAALDIDTEVLRTIYEQVDPMKDFEEQRDFWVNESSPYYYEHVYGPQIETLEKAGVLHSNKKLTPDDAFLAPQVYKQMAKFKADYESMAKSSSRLSGQAKKVAEEAKRHYKNRNYLDAYRFMAEATK